MAIRQLILVPVLMRAWGSELYGEWLVVTAIPSFLAMSNLGLGTSAQIKIGMDMAAGRNKQVMEAMITASVMISAIALAVCAAVFLLVPHLYKSDLGKVHIPRLEFVLLFLVLCLFLKMLAQPFSGLWTGVGRPSVSGHANNICSIFELACTIVIPLLGGGAFWMTFVMLIINVIWIVLFFCKTYPLISNRGMAMASPDWKLGRAMMVTGVGHQVGPLWQAILFQGSIIIANSALGPIGAATWGSLRTLARCGNQLLELVSQTLGPEFQLEIGKGDYNKLRRLFALGLLFSLAISFAMACGLILIGPLFFKVWTHGTSEVSELVWILMGASLIPFSLWWLGGEFQRAINRPWALNLSGVCIALVVVFIMWLLSRLGMVSFAVGSLVFEILMAIAILPRTYKIVQDDLGGSLVRGFKEAKIWCGYAKE